MSPLNQPLPPLSTNNSGCLSSFARGSYVFHIRQGVHFALDPDSEASRLVGGRELTADDVVFTYQRNLALGEFTDRPEQSRQLINLPWESIEATDKYTVVMKLKEPSLSALGAILDEPYHWILPREVVEHYGDYADWRNVVGTGPFLLTAYAEGVSRTYTRNPDYWGSDEKYPENRLPYVDQLRALFMEEEATRLAALRSGKLDLVARLLRFPGYSQTRQKAKDRFAWAGFRFQEQREGHDRRTQPRCTRY